MIEESCIRVLADPVQIRECKKELGSKQPAFERLSNVLSLAGNGVRLKILYLLNSQKELCPCDMSDILQMSIPAVSQHLRKLKDGGIVGSRKVGQTIFYYLNAHQLKTLRPFFKQIKEASKIEAL